MCLQILILLLFSCFLFWDIIIIHFSVDVMAKDTSAKENLNMDDFESLLATLSAEDLENINELVDPEVGKRIFSFDH